METPETRRAAGALIEDARTALRISKRELARRARISETWYRALTTGLRGTDPQPASDEVWLTLLKVSSIKVPDKDIPVLDVDQVTALLKTCRGNSFENRRDRAIILTLLDNGVRVSGLVGLRYTPDDTTTHDIHLDQGVLRVRLKGGRETLVPIGRACAHAIDRYLRARRDHPRSHLPALWLGPKGPLTDSGVRQMLRRRAGRAGIDHVHPHLFRHTAAHMLRVAGLSEQDLMAICGWESDAMAKRYGRSAAAARARAAHRRVAPGDLVA